VNTRIKMSQKPDPLQTVPRSNQRVLIGPCEIAGYYSKLVVGFRAIGVQADFVTYATHPFGYGGETLRPRSIEWMRALNMSRARYGRRSLVRLFLGGLALVCQLAWFALAAARYKTFIFGYGQSWLPYNLDLLLLRPLGKRVISVLAHGSEARPPFVDGALLSGDGRIPTAAIVRNLARFRRRRVRRHLRYASFVIGAPYSTTPYSHQPMINLFAIGVPCDALACQQQHDRSTPRLSHPNRRSIRILHAPSHPAAKGSRLISHAIERLRSRGYQIEFVTLTGRPSAEVQQELRRCDFVVDQIYSDTPMAGLATEAARFGKPSVVAGYGLGRLRKHVPEGMWPPSMLCHPDQLESTIEELLVDKRQRDALGLAAQSFVHERWAACAVAERFLRLVEGDVPEHWWVDPTSVSYIEGWGIANKASSALVRQLIFDYGLDALQLSHRPDLERAYLAFAGLTKTE
jgi:hypothetical protein